MDQTHADRGPRAHQSGARSASGCSPDSRAEDGAQLRGCWPRAAGSGRGPGDRAGAGGATHRQGCTTAQSSHRVIPDFMIQGGGTRLHRSAAGPATSSATEITPDSCSTGRTCWPGERDESRHPTLEVLHTTAPTAVDLNGQRPPSSSGEGHRGCPSRWTLGSGGFQEPGSQDRKALRT